MPGGLTPAGPRGPRHGCALPVAQRHGAALGAGPWGRGRFGDPAPRRVSRQAAARQKNKVFIFQAAACAHRAPAGPRRRPPPGARRRRPRAGCSSQPGPPYPGARDPPKFLPATAASSHCGAGAGAGVGAVPARGPAGLRRLRLPPSPLRSLGLACAGCGRLRRCLRWGAHGPGSSPRHPQRGDPPHLQAVAPEVPPAALRREEGRAAGRRGSGVPGCPRGDLGEGGRGAVLGAGWHRGTGGVQGKRGGTVPK